MCHSPATAGAGREATRLRMDAKMSGQATSATTTASTITTQEVIELALLALDLLPAEGDGVDRRGGWEFGEFSHESIPCGRCPGAVGGTKVPAGLGHRDGEWCGMDAGIVRAGHRGDGAGTRRRPD